MSDRPQVPDDVVDRVMGTMVNVFELPETTVRMLRRRLREVMSTHRLIQLPAEPTSWEYEIRDHYNGGVLRWDGPMDGDAAVAQVDTPKFTTTGRIRPVYTIVGTPIDVTEDERP